MKKQSYFVGPNGDNWQVKRGGNKTPSIITHTKYEAMKRGRELAIKYKTELVEQGKDGRIIDSDSYGNDPRKTKG